MHKDFNDLLCAFNARDVQYMIVGGYAYSRYTEPRATKDLDLFVNPDPQNAHKTYRALVDFGAYLQEVAAEDFSKPTTVFQIGVAPFRVDLLFGIDGISFEEAWTTSELALVDDSIPVRYISLEALIKNKLAAGRSQDIADVEKLRRAGRVRKPAL